MVRKLLLTKDTVIGIQVRESRPRGLVLGNTATVALSTTGARAAASSLRRFSVLGATTLGKPRGEQRTQRPQIEYEDSATVDIVRSRGKGKAGVRGEISGDRSFYNGRGKMSEGFQDTADRMEDLALSGGAGRGGKNRRGGRRGGGGGGAGQSRQVLISKALSTLLRHQAQNAGIKLDAEGFAPLDKVTLYSYPIPTAPFMATMAAPPRPQPNARRDQRGSSHEREAALHHEAPQPRPIT
ncbi:hypothetical protein NPX13_g2075 [Xylaria arbuscula]|uniref:2'-phosphotransferase n=1 Tax=Xylaria arbuscula TaxID=114810 RepID=A0A9W8NJW4_9PEZI|nr:hypothetical protein NPX13_g2075 [Xylaria arbuscula]